MTGDTEGGRESGPKARVFISYSRKDAAFADRLEAALKARGFEPLIDHAEILAFEDWWNRLTALIARADTVAFVLSPDAVASKEVQKEVEYAASLNKRFAPIVCRRTEDAAVPDVLRRLNFIFFDDPDRFEQSADALAAALQTDIGWIRQHTAVGEAARRWSEAGRAGGLLLRSPVLEEAERWIASRPHGAPTPTGETQAFVAESRRGATRRRNLLTGSLAAGLVIALGLAGLAYWQATIANEERKRAEATLAAATKTANRLVFDLAQRFRETSGIPAALIKDILDRARALQQELMKSGQLTPELSRSAAAAHSETVTSLLAIGDTAGALDAAQQSTQIFTALRAGNPADTDWARELSVAHLRIGDVRFAQGDIDAALAAYREGLAISAALTKGNPANPYWQRDLGLAFGKIGDMQVAQGKLPDGLTSYRDSLAAMKRAVEREPGEARWQRELSVAFDKVAQIQVAQGSPGEALQAGREVLAALEVLVKNNPGNAARKHDLAIAHLRIGDAQAAQGSLANALASYRTSLSMLGDLARSDPSNSEWQRELSTIQNRVGQVQAAQGNLPEALASNRAALAIAVRLAKADPNNAGWQRELSVSHDKVGDVLIAQGNPREALASYREALSIREQLTRKDPKNSGWTRDLAVSHDNVARVLLAQNDLPGAIASYRAAIATFERFDAAVWAERAHAELRASGEPPASAIRARCSS